MTVSDKALAQAWRNRFISERMNAYRDDGYEVCRAKAEADANDFEDAFIAASNKRTPPAQAAEAVRVTKQMCYRAIDAYTEAVGEGWQQPCVEGMCAALDAAIAAMQAGEGKDG